MNCREDGCRHTAYHGMKGWKTTIACAFRARQGFGLSRSPLRYRAVRPPKARGTPRCCDHLCAAGPWSAGSVVRSPSKTGCGSAPRCCGELSSSASATAFAREGQEGVQGEVIARLDAAAKRSDGARNRFIDERVFQCLGNVHFDLANRHAR